VCRIRRDTGDGSAIRRGSRSAALTDRSLTFVLLLALAHIRLGTEGCGESAKVRGPVWRAACSALSACFRRNILFFTIRVGLSIQVKFVLDVPAHLLGHRVSAVGRGEDLARDEADASNEQHVLATHALRETGQFQHEPARVMCVHRSLMWAPSIHRVDRSERIPRFSVVRCAAMPSQTCCSDLRSGKQ